MAKSNNKQRAGLQKKVSSVFKGVSVPGANHTDRPSHKPAQKDTVASSPAMQVDDQALSDPEVKKIDRPGQPMDRTVPKRLSVSAPPASSATKSAPKPETKKLVRPNESADKAAPKVASASAPPVSTDARSAPKPEAKKLVRPDESAGKAAPQRSPLSPPPATTSLKSPQSPEAKKLDRPEQHVERSVPQPAATGPKPVSTDRQGSQSTLLKRMAQCEESSDKSAQAEVKTPPSKPAEVKTEVPSSKPAKAKAEIEKPLDKPAPVKQPQDDVFTEAGGLSLCQQIRDRLAASRLGAGSTKDKVMVMLVPLLAIVTIFMFRQVLQKSPGQANAAANDETPVVAAADSGDEIDWELPEPLPAVMRNPLELPGENDEQGQDPENNDNANDPKQGPATGKTQATDLRIRGLVYSEDKPSVVIGNTIAHVGTTIQGVTVVRINRDSVELEKDGKTWVQKVRD